MGDDFPSDWTLSQLKDCMAAIIDYRGKSPTKTLFGVPLVTAKVVKGGRILPTDEFIAAQDYDSWMRRGLPEPGDVVMTTEAPLGEVAQLDTRKVALAQRLITLRGRTDKLDNTFLKFLMQSAFVQEQLKARSTGTTVLGIRQSELRLVSLPLPPLAEQRAIAHILGTLDDKIELNRRMNETLEGMARAIFKSWFVDFDPVRAKADGRAPTGMDPATAALFPDSFEDSPLGKIPKGWKVGRLGEVLDLAYGKALKEELRQPGNVPVFGSNSQVGFHNVALVEGPGIIVGRKGNPGIVKWAARSFFPIDTTFYVVPKAAITSLHFLFFALQEHDLAALGADSAVPGLNRNMAYLSNQIIAPNQVIARFDEIIRPIFELIESFAQQSYSLAICRDALLPKLLSGEIRVPEAEKIVERAM